MDTFKLPEPANLALSKLQDTKLDPMEEALFQAWTRANGVEKPDAPGNTVDYRGVYKSTNGLVLPQGQLKRIGDDVEAQKKLERILHERYQERISKVAQGRVTNSDAGTNKIGKE